MKILILEDSSDRIDEFKKKLVSHEVVITNKPSECIKFLEEGKWDYLFLDHDMGVIFEKPSKGTGYEVALWIAEHTEYCPRHILIHSMNNVGAAAMMQVLGSVGVRATYIPLLWEKIRI
jgi:CheY-like chemotaxis protein